MSKYVKELITQELRSRLEGVNELVVVDVIGLNANASVDLRKQLREQNLSLLVVKNSLARRATEGTALAPAFDGLVGSAAIVWGDDIVTLAKSVVKISEDKAFERFNPRGGAMDGGPVSADEVKNISKWPSREEQLGILLGQITSVGSQLSSQLISAGANLASQISQRAEGETTEE